MGGDIPRLDSCITSDRGNQYASQPYQALLQRHQMVGSMSRRGNFWDNAVVERVFRSVKHEGLDDTASKQPSETVKATVIDYMEMFYNSHRLHSTLGYLSPNAFEAQAQGLTPQPGETQGGTKAWPMRRSFNRGQLWKPVFRRMQGKP
ncbi:MAG: integrase core domain-containing protein [Nitrospirales bacterium]